MPVLGLIFEQLMQWRFGMVGAVGSGLLLFGLKARSETCQCIAVIVLVLLFV